MKKPIIFYNGNDINPQALSIDYKSMKLVALKGWKEQQNFYKKIFPEDLYFRLNKIFKQGKIDIDMDTWIEILFHAIKTYTISEYRHRVIESLKPLYFARTDSYIKQTLDWDYETCEKEIINQAKLCFKKRDELLKLFNK